MQNAERLADLAFKMAEVNLYDSVNLERAFYNSSRPAHVAILKKKVPCLHVFCKEKISFYKEEGLDHHFCTVHRKPVW